MSQRMNSDKVELLKYGCITVVLVVGCFALTSVSRSIYLQVLLGWVGVGILVLYFRWLHKNKLRLRNPNGKDSKRFESSVPK